MRSRWPVQLLLLATVAALFASNAFADLPRRHRVDRDRIAYEVRSAQVPLQPFSFNDPPPRVAPSMQVAYYAPRAIPRAQRIEREQEEVGPTPDISRASGPTVPGNRAVLRNGVAYAPANAPPNVKSAIWAINTIRSKPYHWGGGHGSFYDSGYDCSGTVSFALHNAGVLNQPLPSSDFLRYGERGHGRWITIYARHGHTFATIAGLRLDTTDLRYGSDVGPRWYADGRETWGFETRHPVGL
jgi:hypothetical protein